MPKKTATMISAFDSADEMVAEILSDANRRKDEMQLTPRERQLLADQRRKEAARKARADQKAKNQAPNRTVLLLPTDLKDRLESIANWQGIPISQIATYLLYEAISQFDTGAINFAPYKTPSYSPRYQSELIHPLDAERRQRRVEKKSKNGWG